MDFFLPFPGSCHPSVRILRGWQPAVRRAQNAKREREVSPANALPHLRSYVRPPPALSAKVRYRSHFFPLRHSTTFLPSGFGPDAIALYECGTRFRFCAS
jgi:hypothetical protein